MGVDLNSSYVIYPISQVVLDKTTHKSAIARAWLYDTQGVVRLAEHGNSIKTDADELWWRIKASPQLVCTDSISGLQAISLPHSSGSLRGIIRALTL
jgi:tRNA U34 5-methylaminomethyl-2-thiouridine-forming methyltransferase MnmC